MLTSIVEIIKMIQNIPIKGKRHSAIVKLLLTAEKNP